MGAPGAGKGTQAEIISERLNIPTISTGQILRSAIKNETPIGKEAKAYIDRGDLVPDDVIIGIVRERLAEDDCKNGYILDGVPRTLVQAETLDRMGIRVDATLYLNVHDHVIEHRIGGRRVCTNCGETYHITANPPAKEGFCDRCGGSLSVRADDAPETVRERLAVYHQQTEPLVSYYKKHGRFVSVDGEETVAETTNAIFKALGIEE